MGCKDDDMYFVNIYDVINVNQLIEGIKEGHLLPGGWPVHSAGSETLLLMYWGLK